MTLDPPTIATWLLLRLVSGPKRESLIGDLIERHQQKRETTWVPATSVSRHHRHQCRDDMGTQDARIASDGRWMVHHVRPWCSSMGCSAFAAAGVCGSPLGRCLPFVRQSGVQSVRPGGPRPYRRRATSRTGWVVRSLSPPVPDVDGLRVRVVVLDLWTCRGCFEAPLTRLLLVTHLWSPQLLTILFRFSLLWPARWSA